MTPTDLLQTDDSFDAVVVDEAAQIPVSVLQRIVERHRGSDLVFATTTHGYEGTGRGFGVRFLEWLRDRRHSLATLELEEPIRWARADPLESLVFDTLLLDAEPARIDPDRVAPADELEHVRLASDRLASDDRLLREVFGLLVRAHYRTTPSDLQKLLDAPNLAVHALVDGRQVVAATWAAREGKLPPDVRDEIFRGQRRILGHALPEILASRLGRREAGALEMIRSVRTAVHPDVQRRGIGSRLIEQIHRTYEPDLFGTVFSASPGVVDFRRHVGHDVVHLGTSRGRRSGQPSVTMIRPASERGRELYRKLRRAFARRLPLQLELADADATVPIDSGLRDRLASGLPTAISEPDAYLDRHVAHYAYGPRTHESAAYAVEQFARSHSDDLDVLEPSQRALVEERVLARQGWTEAADTAEVDTVRAAMRGLRRALRALVEHVRPDLQLGDARPE